MDKQINILSPASFAAKGANTTMAKNTKHNISSLNPSHLTPVKIKNHADV
jgi:hypothetical protein